MNTPWCWLGELQTKIIGSVGYVEGTPGREQDALS